MRFMAKQWTVGQVFVNIHLFFPVQNSILIFTFMLSLSEGQAGAISELSKKVIFS
jgi:hypothetical protein